MLRREARPALSEKGEVLSYIAETTPAFRIKAFLAGSLHPGSSQGCGAGLLQQQHSSGEKPNLAYRALPPSPLGSAAALRFASGELPLPPLDFPFEGSLWVLKLRRQSRSLVPSTAWYCAEGKVKAVNNNPPSANHSLGFVQLLCTG